jgi:hypothetical protein
LHRHVLVTALLACALAGSVASTASAESASSVSNAAALQALENARNAFINPLSAGNGSSTGSRDATIALRDLAVALPALNGSDKQEARSFLARPTDKNDKRYFGKEADGSPICDTQFCVHWTDKAKNAPVSNLFLTEVLDATALSYAVENTALGWKNAKSDGTRGSRNGVGTDGQVDVYITDLGENLYGYASTDPGQKGGKRFAYLVLDNNYVGFPTSPIKSMRVTVAHEYNHILQFNYDVYEDVWLFEDTATWVEEKVYPTINDYVNYIPALASKPNTPMTGSSIKIYAEAVWNHWLSYKFGDDVVRNTWVESPSQKSFAVDSYNKAIKGAGGTTFGAELGQYFTETAEWHSSSSFPDAAEYPNVKRSGTVEDKTIKTGLDNTSYRLYDVQPTMSASTRLKVKAEKGTRSTIALIGREGVEPGILTREIVYLPKGGKGEVTLEDPGKFSRITAVVANVDGRSNHLDKKGRRVYKSDGSDYKLSLGG